ncbi:cupredoxin domain-containing protein [Telmatospirillum siberiense]|uniref:Ferrous iron transporter n=1 Tax=Telmatospirillum siberiense TaxID=382514 RepID=A0A2N3Q117_9PROT|nr:cupredoxin domain-containing protein [Telmatospirillum siberiense]PKU26358.1 ferrous iron transporter [Telmatospirillum siberiense]
MPFTRSQRRWGAGISVFILAAAGMIGAYTVEKSRRLQLKASAETASPVKPAAAREITVTVTAKTCEPAHLTAPAGKIAFRIVNQSQRVLEWEILKGVMVVDERENIAPGFAQTLTTTLQAGDYEITCGLLGNPRGTLTVTADGAAGAGRPVKPTPVELIGPTVEYKVFISLEADDLIDALRDLADAAKTGDLTAARSAYAQARSHYLRIATTAGLFDDLDKTITEDLLQAGKTLFPQHVPQGLPPAADRLAADAAALQTRLRDLSVPPGKMVAGAAAQVRAIGDGKDGLNAQEPPDLRARLDGVRKIVALLRPLSERTDPALSGRIDATVTALQEALIRPHGGTPAANDALRRQIGELADDLTKLGSALGLS